MDDLPNAGAPITTFSAILASISDDARKPIIALLAFFAVAFLVVFDSHWPDEGTIHESIEWAGRLLLAICIIGRTACTLYIGGRKNNTVVEDGPYSICRNPLYLFSIIGTVGVGAQFASVVIALSAGLLIWAVFRWVVYKEEATMLRAFPDEYRLYMARVPRFLPKFSLWRTPETLVVNPRNVYLTFADSLLLLLSIPVKELFDYLHTTGMLPVYVLLP
jgi:protein-S-isoprenylcysteine O-methyltransferase Ste14